MRTIFLKEFKSLFNTFSGYVFIALFLFGGGIIFAVSNLAESSASVAPVLTGLEYILLIITPLLTFRLFENKGSKTIRQGRREPDRTLLSSPLTSGQIALFKFFAAFSVLFAALAVSLIYPAILALLGAPAWGEALTAYFGILLYGGLLISIGVFVSALLCDRKAAVTVTLAAMLVILLTEAVIPDINNTFLSAAVFKALPSFHLYYFESGFLNLPSLIYFISLSALFIFLSREAVERRKRS
jgi:ABC-2 type transport system permease protein